MEVSRAMGVVHESCTQHELRFDSDWEKFEHAMHILTYVKRVKPRCSKLKLWFRLLKAHSMHMSLQDAKNILHNLVSFINSQFTELTVMIVHCDNEIVDAILEPLSTIRIQAMTMQFYSRQRVSYSVQSKMKLLQTGEFHLVLHDAQLPLLLDVELMQLVTNIDVATARANVVNLMLLDGEHVRVKLYVSNINMIIRGTNNIHELFLTDLIWTGHDGEEPSFPLVNSIRQGGLARLERVSMIDKHHDVSMLHAFDNFWHILCATLPKTCSFQYMTHSHNMAIVPILRRMLEILGLPEDATNRLTFANYDKDTYLLSKMVREFVGVEGSSFCDTFTEGYKPSEQLQKMTLVDVYDNLSEDLRVVWYWLEACALK